MELYSVKKKIGDNIPIVDIIHIGVINCDSPIEQIF